MAGFDDIRPSTIFNKLLRRIGLQVIRTRNLDELVLAAQEHAASTQATRGENPSSAVDIAALESRVSTLEDRTEQSSQNVIRYAMKAHWRTVDLIEQATGSDKPDACPLCGHRAPREDFKEVASNCIFLGGRLLRHECPSCNVIFGPQKMLSVDEEMLDLDYRNLYRIYSEGSSTDSMIRTFHLLKPTGSGVYLDFGCGGEWSEAIERLRGEGWNVFGFEPSASHSSEHVFSKWEELADKRFDGIFSHNVLEHLFDPAAITRRLSDLLTGDGSIVHATPCFDYRYDFTHYHVYFFTGRSAEVLAEKAGMYIADWVRDGEFIACTLKKRSRQMVGSA